MTYLPPLTDQDPYGEPPRRRRSKINWPVALAVAVLAGLIAATFLRPDTVSDRDRDDKIVRVVLPPPPEPPPPPEVQPEERPPEPTPTPLDQPVDDTPPPPDAPAQPTAGDSALTARVGAGPSNYGLAAGDGGGTRIGGRAGGGGDAFGAYGSFVSGDLRRALQQNRELTRGRYTIVVLLDVDAGGAVQNVRLAQGTGDARRDEAIRRFLTGRRLSRPPPPGLPGGVRLEFTSRPSV